MPSDAQKDSLRSRVSAARSRVTDGEWSAVSRAMTRSALNFADARPTATVALYASRAAEPETGELITELARRGWRVLLPVIRRAVDWAEFGGWDEMAVGWGGIPQPTGPRLGAPALASASLIFVPCTAIGRDFSRLGTGGGWYDRALLHRSADAAVIALVREADVFDTVPTEPHDVAVDGYITEAGATFKDS